MALVGGLSMQAKLLAVGVVLAATGLFITGTHLQLSSNLPGIFTSSSPAMAQRRTPVIVVIGSGLAGTAAALTAAEAAEGVRVVLLEKEGRPGGNSMKASSGVNALTPEQGDSAAAFRRDTLASGGGLSHADLVDALGVR